MCIVYVTSKRRLIMSKITKTTTIGEALKLNENAEAILQGFGMHCVHCPMSQMETLEEAGAVHGIDVELMVQKLNEENK
jgi:hybrid cluster-associated redox disulfide protein